MKPAAPQIIRTHHPALPPHALNEGSETMAAMKR
jgi:hypothetical protein